MTETVPLSDRVYVSAALSWKRSVEEYTRLLGFFPERLSDFREHLPNQWHLIHDFRHIDMWLYDLRDEKRDYIHMGFYATWATDVSFAKFIEDISKACDNSRNSIIASDSDQQLKILTRAHVELMKPQQASNLKILALFRNIIKWQRWYHILRRDQAEMPLEDCQKQFSLGVKSPSLLGS